MTDTQKGRDRPQERPSQPEPPTSDFERLESAAEALRATAHAWVDFCEANHWDRKQTAFRNFLSNGASVTFLIQGLRHGRDDEFNEWYAPIQRAMRSDPLFRFFWDMRTDSMKRVAPSLGSQVRYTIPPGVISITGPQMSQELQPFIVGTAHGGRKVAFLSDSWTYTVKALH